MRVEGSSSAGEALRLLSSRPFLPDLLLLAPGIPGALLRPCTVCRAGGREGGREGGCGGCRCPPRGVSRLGRRRCQAVTVPLRNLRRCSGTARELGVTKPLLFLASPRPLRSRPRLRRRLRATPRRRRAACGCKGATGSVISMVIRVFWSHSRTDIHALRTDLRVRDTRVRLQLSLRTLITREFNFFLPITVP